MSSNLGHKFVPNVLLVKSKFIRRDDKLLVVTVDNVPWPESLDVDVLLIVGGNADVVDFDPLIVCESNGNFRIFFDEPLESAVKALSGVSSIDLWTLFELRPNDRRAVKDENEDFVVDTDVFVDDNTVVSDRKDE